MAEVIPKKTILVLLLLTIVISVLGTLAVLNYSQAYTKDTAADAVVSAQAPEPVGTFRSSSQGAISLTVVAPDKVNN